MSKLNSKMKDIFPSDTDRHSYCELLIKMLTSIAECQQSCSRIDWSSVEADFGFELPCSFKLISSNLPAGFLGTGITWTSPAAKLPAFRFDPYASECYSSLLKDSGVLPIYPTFPGFLVFATTMLRIDLAFWVEPMASGAIYCQPTVNLIEPISGEVEATGVEIDEFLYRSITDSPHLGGPLSGRFHEWFFADPSSPLFQNRNSP